MLLLNHRFVVRRILAAGITVAIGASPASAAPDWVGLATDDNWSSIANWSPAAAPVSIDTVTFNAAASGTANIIDQDFEIAGLEFLGGGIHGMSVLSSKSLEVNGNVAVGFGGSGADVDWLGSGVISIGDVNLDVQMDIGTQTSGSVVGSLILDGPTVNASISQVYVGRKASSAGGGAANGTLVSLGATNLTINGTTASPGAITLGYNQDTNAISGGYGASAGELNALDGTVSLDVGEISVGRSLAGASSGTLRWDQIQPILATTIYFGRGMGATGVLDIPAAGNANFGTLLDPVENFRIAYTDFGQNSASNTNAVIDLTTNDPFFEAHIASELSIGRKTIGTGGSTTTGRLLLGSNSILNVGTELSPGLLYIGLNSDSNAISGGYGNVIGELDALLGDVTLELSELNVGFSAAGPATGTLRWDSSTPIHASIVSFGRGMGANGILDVPAAGAIRLGSTARPMSSFRIAYTDFGQNSASNTNAVIDLTTNDPFFEAHIASELSIGRKTIGTGGSTTTGRLLLGSNSILNVGTELSPGLLYIGLNSDSNAISGGYGNVIGELDALLGDVTLELSELNVGFSAAGPASGTLRWDSITPIYASAVSFGRGGGANGVLDVPVGGTILLGDSSRPLTNLNVGLMDFAQNSSGVNTFSEIDLTLNNPTFSAFVDGNLSIGRKPIGTAGNTATGRLILGSNSSLALGSASARGNVFIGYNQDANAISGGYGNSVGVLQGGGGLTVFANLFYVGVASAGAASGTFVQTPGDVVDVTSLVIGSGGTAVGGYTLAGGILRADTVSVGSAGGTFSFSDGQLRVGMYNGALVQSGGTLSVGNESGDTTFNGDYTVSSTGSVELEFFGREPWVESDGLIVNGAVDVSGSTLIFNQDGVAYTTDVLTIIDNDGTDAIVGEFSGWADGAQIPRVLRGLSYIFEVDYEGGDGNDLTFTSVPEPESMLLLAAGVVGLIIVARDRRAAIEAKELVG